jgi:hypothetical protein
MDLDRYSEWNPYIVDASGRFARGARVPVRVAIPGRGSTGFRAPITGFEPERCVEWYTQWFIRGILDRRYRCTLQPITEGTLVTQREEHSGFLSRLTGAGEAEHAISRGLRSMNEALLTRTCA